MSSFLKDRAFLQKRALEVKTRTLGKLVKFSCVAYTHEGVYIGDDDKIYLVECFDRSKFYRNTNSKARQVITFTINVIDIETCKRYHVQSQYFVDNHKDVLRGIVVLGDK